jgi:hypothetical protein
MTTQPSPYQASGPLGSATIAAWSAAAAAALLSLAVPTSSAARFLGYLHFGAVVLTVLWTYRVYSNLEGVGVTDRRFSPAWAAASYFIPVANLFIPYQVLSETTTVTSTAAKSPGRLLLVWWLAYLGAYLAWLERDMGKGNLAVYGGCLVVVAVTSWNIVRRIDRQLVERRTTLATAGT